MDHVHARQDCGLGVQPAGPVGAKRDSVANLDWIGNDGTSTCYRGLGNIGLGWKRWWGWV